MQPNTRQQAQQAEQGQGEDQGGTHDADVQRRQVICNH